MCVLVRARAHAHALARARARRRWREAFESQLAKGKGLGAPLEVSTDIALDAKVIARSKGHGNRMPSRVGYDDYTFGGAFGRAFVFPIPGRACCIPTSSPAQHYGSATTLHWKRHKS